MELELRVKNGGGVEHIVGLFDEDVPELELPEGNTMEGVDLTAYAVEVLRERGEYESVIAIEPEDIIIGRYPAERDGVVGGMFTGIYFPKDFDPRLVELYCTERQKSVSRVRVIRQAAGG